MIRVVHLITNFADIKKLYCDTICLFIRRAIPAREVFPAKLGNDSEQLTFRSFLVSFFQGPHGVTDPTMSILTDKSTTRQSPRTLSETRTGPTEFVRPGSPTKSGRAGLVEFGFYCAFK